jgi:hypothetical protein
VLHTKRRSRFTSITLQGELRAKTAWVRGVHPSIEGSQARGRRSCRHGIPSGDEISVVVNGASRAGDVEYDRLDLNEEMRAGAYVR